MHQATDLQVPVPEPALAAHSAQPRTSRPLTRHVTSERSRPPNTPSTKLSPCSAPGPSDDTAAVSVLDSSGAAGRDGAVPAAPPAVMLGPTDRLLRPGPVTALASGSTSSVNGGVPHPAAKPPAATAAAAAAPPLNNPDPCSCPAAGSTRGPAAAAAAAVAAAAVPRAPVSSAALREVELPSGARPCQSAPALAPSPSNQFAPLSEFCLRVDEWQQMVHT